jgi:hypothetical protein
MHAPEEDPDSALTERLRTGPPLTAVELRPPAPDLPQRDSIDTWIDLHHAIRRLTRDDSLVFLTDDAVGEREEENLRHLTTNLAGAVDLARVVPFLTCKHSLPYCLNYAQRAASAGLRALTVLGGDTSSGPPRCVEHAYILRKEIRRRVPSLALGGWANPHGDPARQVGYLRDDDFCAEYYLTQVVSHHQMARVEAFLEEVREQAVDLPAVFGVFYYRSANPRTLERLARYFPVPAGELEREFGRGDDAAEICARTVKALRDVGVRHVYVSNLPPQHAPDHRRRVLERVGEAATGG